MLMGYYSFCTQESLLAVFRGIRLLGSSLGQRCKGAWKTLPDVPSLGLYCGALGVVWDVQTFLLAALLCEYNLLRCWSYLSSTPPWLIPGTDFCPFFPSDFQISTYYILTYIAVCMDFEANTPRTKFFAYSYYLFSRRSNILLRKRWKDTIFSNIELQRYLWFLL